MITCRSYAPDTFAANVPLRELGASGWVHISAAVDGDCRSINRTYGIPLSFLEAAQDNNERPRLEYLENTLLMLLRLPREHDDTLRQPYSTCPAAFILRGNLLITVCYEAHPSAKILEIAPAQHGSRTAVMHMLGLFMHICSTYIQYLQHLDDCLGSVESAMQASMHNNELLRILHVDKSLIYFLTALKGNHSVLEKLSSGARRAARQEEKTLLEDVLIENKQAIDMAEIYSQIIGSIGDTFSGMISNNLNKVMKILTGLTIVFTVPAVISSIYGMNVPLPGADSPYSFLALSAATLAIMLGVYRILKKRDWM